MTWRYQQSTGDLWQDAEFVGTGYSGAGEGRNNPAMEAVVGQGPIPKGQWKIGPAHDSPHTGPVSMDLNPVGHDAHGRTLFRVHGNNATNNASRGCVILARGIRQEMASSGDHGLEVF